MISVSVPAEPATGVRERGGKGSGLLRRYGGRQHVGATRRCGDRAAEPREAGAAGMRWPGCASAATDAALS